MGEVPEVDPGRPGRRRSPGAVHHRRDPVVRRAARRHHRRRALGPARGSWACMPPPTPARRGRNTGRWSGPGSTGTPGPRPSTSRSTSPTPARGISTTVWRWRDEVYLFRDLRPDARVLLRVAEGQLDMDVPGARRPLDRLPAWRGASPKGQGRVFYTVARALPRRLGDPRLPPAPPGRVWPGSSATGTEDRRRPARDAPRRHRRGRARPRGRTISTWSGPWAWRS